MVQATTPTFILTLPDTVDLTIIQNMYFSLEQANTKLRKTGNDLSIEGNTVSVYLTQEETLKFNRGYAELQLNWTYPDGHRACSDIVTIPVGPNLIKEVVS